MLVIIMGVLSPEVPITSEGLYFGHFERTLTRDV